MKLWQMTRQWIEKADQKDRLLDKNRRIWKWSLIMGGSFVLFGLSFIQQRQTGLSHHSIMNPDVNPYKDMDTIPVERNAFELPTDSFEQLLKQQINEKYAQ